MSKCVRVREWDGWGVPNADALHQQDGAEHLVGLQEMVHVGARVVCAGEAAAAGDERRHGFLARRAPQADLEHGRALTVVHAAAKRKRQRLPQLRHGVRIP